MCNEMQIKIKFSSQKFKFSSETGAEASGTEMLAHLVSLTASSVSQNQILQKI